MLFYIQYKSGLYKFRKFEHLNECHDIAFQQIDIDDNKQTEEIARLLEIINRQSSSREHEYISIDLLNDGVRLIEISQDEELFLLKSKFRHYIVCKISS